MLRATGDTVRPLIFLTSGGVVNVILNAVMILVFGMGALGVGIATAVSFWVSCVLVVIYMSRTKGLCTLCFRELRIDFGSLKRVLKIGIPAGIEDSLFSFSNALIQSSINSFCQSAITAVGQNHGAKDYKRLKKSILVCGAVLTVTMLVLGAILLIFAKPLLALFVPDNPEAIGYGLIRLRIMAATYFIAGLMSMGSYSLRGLGRSLTSTTISLVGTCLLRVVWIYTVFACFRSFAMIFYAYPVTWILTAIVTYFVLHFTLKKMIREDRAATHDEAQTAHTNA